jgi:hypothetical protein
MRSTLGRLVIAMALLAAAHSAGAADEASSIGVSLGYVAAKRVDSTLVFGGDFRFHLWSVVFVAPEFSYWKKSQSSATLTASVEDLQFGVNAIAVLPIDRRLVFFAGAGGGVHHITGDVGATGSTLVSNSTTDGGADVQGGFDIAAGDNLGFFLAARYDWVLGLSGADSHRLDQYRILGGFRVKF